eukprot:CAMPEP_0196997894 /NCGR_PEP_ID=MMETSP1380-20130617/3400_1 /TAXON_ID=5936 /ORGANISM="Euplotes crassus, Strain CT5" /LENGTH=205 /DNA_ID=CAMNT_0042414275 /DNA_START=351 /DNA_END=965 /DNA_ORIENTATION=-
MHIYKSYKQFKKEEYKLENQLEVEKHTFDSLLKQKEDHEEEIEKLKNVFDIEEDYDDEISSYLLAIKKETQKLEDVQKVGRQDQNLLEFYIKEIDKAQDEICETESHIRKLEKEINDIESEHREIEFNIDEARDELKPYEQKYIEKLNENTSIMTDSLEVTYQERLTKMSKKVSPLTNGSLRSSRKTNNSSVITDQMSRRSKRAK